MSFVTFKISFFKFVKRENKLTETFVSGFDGG